MSKQFDDMCEMKLTILEEQWMLSNILIWKSKNSKKSKKKEALELPHHKQVHCHLLGQCCHPVEPQPIVWSCNKKESSKPGKRMINNFR
jgi:hypothetical protein